MFCVFSINVLILWNMLSCWVFSGKHIHVFHTYIDDWEKTNINTFIYILLLIYMYATTDITAGVVCGAGTPDPTPSLVGVCDARLDSDLPLCLCHTYFVIMSIDSGLWNVNLSDCLSVIQVSCYIYLAILCGYGKKCRQTSCIRCDHLITIWFQ